MIQKPKISDRIYQYLVNYGYLLAYGCLTGVCFAFWKLAISSGKWIWNYSWTEIYQWLGLVSAALPLVCLMCLRRGIVKYHINDTADKPIWYLTDQAPAEGEPWEPFDEKAYWKKCDKIKRFHAVTGLVLAFLVMYLVEDIVTLQFASTKS